MPIDMGIRIKKLRKEKGLTQEQLGNLVGVKKAAVQKWESGQVTNLKKSIIKQLSEIFGVLPSYLMGMEDVVDLQPKIPDIFDSAEEAVKFILEQPLVMAYGGYNLETMSDEEIINFANDILFAVKIAAERRKKKNR